MWLFLGVYGYRLVAPHVSLLKSQHCSLNSQVVFSARKVLYYFFGLACHCQWPPNRPNLEETGARILFLSDSGAAAKSSPAVEPPPAMDPEAVRRTIEPTASPADITGSTRYDALVVSGVRLDAAEHGRVLFSFVVTPRLAVRHALPPRRNLKLKLPYAILISRRWRTATLGSNWRWFCRAPKDISSAASRQRSRTNWGQPCSTAVGSVWSGSAAVSGWAGSLSRSTCPMLTQPPSAWDHYLSIYLHLETLYCLVLLVIDYFGFCGLGNSVMEMQFCRTWLCIISW